MIKRSICICCHSPYKPTAETDTCCDTCVKKVMRHNSARSKRNSITRTGRKKISQCPECAVAGIKTELGVREMREHRYDRHGFNFRAGRVVNKGVMGRPRKSV